MQPKAELARRVLLRRRLLPFVQHYMPGYQAGWVHDLTCYHLERFSDAVANGESPRLMLLMPPRHGKSKLASEYFPAWHLGRHPVHELISASYNISLPTGFSRRIRTLMRESSYQKIFDETRLDPESQAVEAWSTTLGGGYIAAGVGGGITGKGAHLLLIDDPIKNAEEADSQTTCEGLWDWYGSTAYTRLAPGGGVLIIQTWWSDNDLAGRVQQEMAEDPEFDQFQIIKFPAIAEEEEWLTPDKLIWRPSHGVHRPEDSVLLRQAGDALHPERYTAEMLARIKKTLMPRHWSALYQQNPVPDDGLYFTKEMFRSLDKPLPGDRYIYQAWDFAITEKQAADFVVGATGALDYEDNIEALNTIRMKGDSFAIVEAMINEYDRFRPLRVGVEDGQIWRAIRPVFEKRCLERRLYPSITELKPITDKAARARPLQGRMAMRKVLWPLDAPWFPTLHREFLRFQAGGTHDDQVDAWAWLAHLILSEAPPRAPQAAPVKSWKDELQVVADGGHMSA
jgi:predicted phage terminase large subunit-like protein